MISLPPILRIIPFFNDRVVALKFQALKFYKKIYNLESQPPPLFLPYSTKSLPVSSLSLIRNIFSPFSSSPVLVPLSNSSTSFYGVYISVAIIAMYSTLSALCLALTYMFPCRAPLPLLSLTIYGGGHQSIYTVESQINEHEAQITSSMTCTGTGGSKYLL